MKVDNFALTMHQACPAKYQLRIVEHWQRRSKGGALGFGAAIHAGLAEWYINQGKTDNQQRLAIATQAIVDAWDENVPTDDWRTLSKCLATMAEYAREYPSESWTIVGANMDRPIIEQTFTLATGMYLPCALSWIGDTTKDSCVLMDLTEDIHEPICGNCGNEREPIEYGGIFDGLIEFGPTVNVLEHKSTSVMGDNYFTQFKPNNQVAGYIWAGRQLSGLPVTGALVNGIGVYRKGKTKFARQLTTRDERDIETFLRNVYASCIDIKTHELTGYFPQRTGECVNKYGRCEFHDVHTLSDVSWQRARLAQDYEQVEWDYTKRDANAEVVSE